jgi:leader peptidase (prepilin peptidase) / N-methyltransferase
MDFLLPVNALPTWYLYLTALGFGLIIGSFLNVYIYRFHTGKSLSGHSHCLSCGKRLKWFDLFPLFSYLALRGRCRYCGSKITSRYFLVELLTGLLFMSGLASMLSNEQGVIDLLNLVLLWNVLALLVVITVYDLNHFIIPDRLTAWLTGVASVMLVYSYLMSPTVPLDLLWPVLSALAGSAFLLALWLVSKGQWLGFGDVKLAFPLGLLVGPTEVFSFIVLSFWVGAGVSLLIIAWQAIQQKRGQSPLHLSGKALTMKSAVPFAPFLVAGCLLVLLTHFNVLQLFSFA